MRQSCPLRYSFLTGILHLENHYFATNYILVKICRHMNFFYVQYPCSYVLHLHICVFDFQINYRNFIKSLNLTFITYRNIFGLSLSSPSLYLSISISLLSLFSLSFLSYIFSISLFYLSLSIPLYLSLYLKIWKYY